jgi:UDP-sulfoquinovose synthase
MPASFIVIRRPRRLSPAIAAAWLSGSSPPRRHGRHRRESSQPQDTLECVRLATEIPAASGELRIFNQFTEQFTVNQLAEHVQKVGRALGLSVEIRSIPNPRKEKEEHYYNAKHSGLLELGLQPHFMTDDVLAAMIETILPFKANIDPNKILPRVRWS